MNGGFALYSLGRIAQPHTTGTLGLSFNHQVTRHRSSIFSSFLLLSLLSFDTHHLVYPNSSLTKKYQKDS